MKILSYSRLGSLEDTVVGVNEQVRVTELGGVGFLVHRKNGTDTYIPLTDIGEIVAQAPTPVRRVAGSVRRQRSKGM